MRVLSLLIVSVLLLTACREGTTVDRGAPSFVDKEPAGSYVDTGSGSTIDNPVKGDQKEDEIINASEKEFVAPPGNYTENATIDIETKKGFIGKDVVKLWVWNSQGSRMIIAQEGSSFMFTNHKVSVGAIGHDNGGEVQISVDEKSRVLKNRQEVKIGDTWVFVSDIFLNAAQ